MRKPIIVVGAGGHAKVVISTLQRQGAKVIGIVEADLSKEHNPVLGVAVIGDDTAVLQYAKDEIQLINGIGSTNSMQLRRKVFLKFKDMGYSFSILVHPAAIVADEVELQEGSQVMAGAVIEAGTIVGCNAIINTGAIVNHDCRIGAHTHLSPGATICGGVQVGEGTHVGAGATIIQEIKIGRDAMVGAGALVIRNVADNKIAYGNPAKEVKEI